MFNSKAEKKLIEEKERRLQDAAHVFDAAISSNGYTFDVTIKVLCGVSGSPQGLFSTDNKVNYLSKLDNYSVHAGDVTADGAVTAISGSTSANIVKSEYVDNSLYKTTSTGRYYDYETFKCTVSRRAEFIRDRKGFHVRFLNKSPIVFTAELMIDGVKVMDLTYNYEIPKEIDISPGDQLVRFINVELVPTPVQSRKLNKTIRKVNKYC